jgi:uncharacterized damage-inducible protein DinB
MNTYVQQHFEVFKATQALRVQLMDLLTDADLSHHPGGTNVSLGELCRGMGEVEQAYIDSFKTFKMDFSYRHPDPAIATSVDRLKAWFAELDAELNALIEGFSEKDLTKTIDRGFGFTPSVAVQAHVYREGILIDCGKASIYLKALEKTPPQQFAAWIG